MAKDKENELGVASGKTQDLEKSQADSGSEVREGQENSSILHDNDDPKKELVDVTEKDISSVNQEEFVDDDSNTKKND